MEIVNLDADLESADWTKQSWDLPPYKSKEFFSVVPIDHLDAFRLTPVYQNAVANLLIHDDEWVGDYIEDPIEAMADAFADFLHIEKSVQKMDSVEKYNEDQPRDDHGRFGEGGGGLNAKEVAAVKEYASGMYGSEVGGYGNLQSVMRTGSPAYPHAYDPVKGSEHIANLKSAFDKSTTEKDQTVYRGLRIEKGKGDELINARPGAVLTDKGVTSTSTSKDVVDRKFSTALNRSDRIVQMAIHVPAGSKAIDVGRVTGSSEEKEMALAPHTRIQITSRSERGGKIYLKAKVLKEDHAAKFETIDLSKLPIDADAHEAATSTLNIQPEPTDAQKEAGNYRKGHIEISGLDISIENPAGSKRRPEWPELASHYGYIRLTQGADGEQIDCFVRPGTDDRYTGPVYIIDQVNEDGSFDEHKVMIGWFSQQKAVAAYLANYKPDWKLGKVTRLDWAVFKDWVDERIHSDPVGKLQKGSDDQPRDEHGRWASSGNADKKKLEEAWDKNFHGQGVFENAKTLGELKIDKATKEAIRAYKMGNSLNKTDRERVEAAIQSHTLGTSGMVYRGVKGEEVIKGSTLKGDDHQSWSGSSRIGQRFSQGGTVLILQVHPDTKGLMIRGSNFRSENEVLLSKNASYSVDRVFDFKYNQFQPAQRVALVSQR